MRKTYIGELEELILLTVALLENQAYGRKITQEIKAQTGHSISISTVYATLYRLSIKGYLESHDGTHFIKKGRSVRLFSLTYDGCLALHNIQRTREQLWKQMPSRILKIP